MTTVCVLSQNFYDFDARVRRKAEALVAAGYSVDVLALRHSPARKNYTVNGVNVYTMPLAKKRASLPRYIFEYAAFFLWALIRVPMLMRRRRYALIEVNTLPDFLIFAPVIGRWMGAKLVLDMHEITPEFYMSKYGIARGSWLVRLMAFLEGISFRFADHVLTISEPIQDLLASRGLPRSKSTVIMNTADETRFVSTRTSRDTEASAENDRFVMMYHGTITPIYGLRIAVEAFDLVRHEMPHAELWILGFGPEEDALKDLIRERNLGSQIKMLGTVPPAEMPTWLQNCDVGLLPMRRDALLDYAFPNKLGEFIVMGKTVIISRLDGLRHYFSEDAITYVEPDDAADLAKKMVRLYRDPGLRRRQAARMKEEYRPIRWDVMKQRYLQLVENLIGASRRSLEHTAAAETTALAR
jgi:glycosyltransferase involved in cell wall biosynthesis